MRTISFTLLLLFSCCQWLAAQCPAYIVFSTQGQIDSFPINYPNCTKIELNVRISGKSISNLQGLNALTSIGGRLEIKSTSDLTSLTGLENLDSVYGGFSISNNKGLFSLQGLESLSYIGEHWQGNPAGGYPVGLWISDNDILATLSGLDSLKTAGNVYISGNDSLYSLNGLGSLYTINRYLIIVGSKFTTFNGLENLYSIGESLNIQSNLSLNSLNGLNNLNTISITNLLVTDNPVLTICDIPPICNYLENGGAATIENNAPGCNSIPEVEAACQASPVKEAFQNEYGVIQINPNPATDFLLLQLPESTTQPTEINLFGSQGRLVERQSFTPGQAVQIGHLPSGFYSVKLTDGKHVYVGKFIKQ